MRGRVASTILGIALLSGTAYVFNSPIAAQAPDAPGQGPVVPPPAVPAPGARGGGPGAAPPTAVPVPPAPPVGGIAYPVPPAGTRPRVIATTDGEIDDRDSMIRFLMYSNEWDIEAIIYNSSRFHWLGNAWAGTEWISDQLDMYSRDYPSLRRHAEGFLSADELRKRVYVGNITNVNEMELDSPGADRIYNVLLDDRPGPVYLQAWGGTNTIAKALSRIQKERPDQMDRVSAKAILYIILDQDNTFRQYIEPNWPKLHVLGSFQQFGVLAFGWRNSIPVQYRVFFERPWLEGHISSNHGALAGGYLSDNTGAFRSEGDSPSFMHQIDVGLRSLENPAYGGWGGRFVQGNPGKTNVWNNAPDDGVMAKAIWRWADAFQNDWAARADWTVKPYSDANHPPIVVLAGPRDLDATPGATIKLDVSGSTDPDGHRLSTSWWAYRDPSLYRGEVSAKEPDRASTTMQIPADAKPGDTIHVIAQVTDDGTPPLTRYARLIVTVKPAPPAPAARPAAR